MICNVEDQEIVSQASLLHLEQAPYFISDMLPQLQLQQRFDSESFS